MFAPFNHYDLKSGITCAVREDLTAQPFRHSRLRKRINPRRSQCWYETGEPGDGSEHQRRSDECQRFGRTNVEQHFLEDAGQGKRSGKTNRNAHAREASTLADTIWNTPEADAPSAIRTPISCLRWATEYAVTP